MLGNEGGFRVLLEELLSVDELVLAVGFVDQRALLAGFLRIFRREEEVRSSLALPLVISIVRSWSVTGVADSVGGGGARVRLVETWPASRADPTGLSAVMGAVSACQAFLALGVATTNAPVHHAPSWTALTAMTATLLMPDARPAFAHLEQKQSGARSEILIPDLHFKSNLFSFFRI